MGAMLQFEGQYLGGSQTLENNNYSFTFLIVLHTRSFFCVEIGTYLPEEQCRSSILVKYALHAGEQGATCG